MPPTSPAAWIPGSLTEWMTGVIVAAFLWMVKSQNDRILPALAEISSAVRALPGAIKDAVRESIKEHDHAGR